MRATPLGLVCLLSACASAPPRPVVRANAPAPPIARADVACAPPAPTRLATDLDRTLYALGRLLGQRVGDFQLTPAEYAIVQFGLADTVSGAPSRVDLRQWGPRVNELAHARTAATYATEQQRGLEYAARMAQEPGARQTPSGLIYRELRAGDGAHPLANSTVRVNYRGTLRDGTEFDSSYERDRATPVEFPLNGVIPCWQEGVSMMRAGGRATLVCPSSIAYGERGQRGIPPGATLTFEVELLEIVARPQGSGETVPSVVSPSR